MDKIALNDHEYILVVEGYDWGPAVSKLIIPRGTSVDKLTPDNFSVIVERSSTCETISGRAAKGELNLLRTYFSDDKGNPQTNGQFISLATAISPLDPLLSPIQYFFRGKCNGNQWIDYRVEIKALDSGHVWNVEKDRIIPLVDLFDTTGKYTSKEGITMSYAHFIPEKNTEKSPLIIWLHGGGEGGEDASIPLIANRAANYASPEIQSYFDGAHVLVPQCPGAWMHNDQGVMTWGEENDIYNQSLMELIESYIRSHPDIDRDRIYLGGCSNGGYMTIKLMLLYPEYFAAGFPSALAYKSEYLSDADIDLLKNQSIWFIHSMDDPVTKANETVIPIYERLQKAQAKKVHLSLFDHVIDITGIFGGDQYYHHGHFSWIYSHANQCFYDRDGSVVIADGKPVSLMGWLAAQTK